MTTQILPSHFYAFYSFTLAYCVSPGREHAVYCHDEGAVDRRQQKVDAYKRVKCSCH